MKNYNEFDDGYKNKNKNKNKKIKILLFVILAMVSDLTVKT